MFKKDLEKEIKEAIETLYQGRFDDIDNKLEVKNSCNLKGADFGDFSTPISLFLAGILGKKPQEVAEEIKSELEKTDLYKNHLTKIEIAGPGFVNFHLKDETINSLTKEVEQVVEKGLDVLKGQKYNIEFISANPTGKLHIGHGRGAFYGDVVSNILEFNGAKIDREFYVNDSRESNQMKELGKTALGLGEQYKTEALEEKIKNIDFEGLSEEEAGFKLGEEVQKDNSNFITKGLGINFNIWYSEDKELRESGVNAETLKELQLKKVIETKEGEGEALWIKTSDYGDDEDRVVVRSDGSNSYFLSDISYHQDKFNRKYDKVIDVWGADHHGHVKRMKAVKEMLGWEGEFEIFITQMVSLKEGGEAKKMSKRAGNVILLEDLVKEFGIDVVRWFFIEKTLNTHMEFDLELAREQSAKNPVYYVQYAHARISSILEKTKGLKETDKNLLDNPVSKNLIMKLAEFSDVLESIALGYSVNKLTTYAHELAGEFSSFYENVRIIEDDTYNKEAVALIETTQKVLAKSLDLLGISAPQKM